MALLDTQENSQTIDQPNHRTIYDAPYSEVFAKSFVAGVALGLGRMVTSVVFLVILGALFIQYVQPILLNTLAPFEKLLLNSSNTTETQLVPSRFFQQGDLLQLFPSANSDSNSTTNTQE